MGLFGSAISCIIFLAVIAVSIWLAIYYLGDRDSLPEQLPDLPEDLRDYLPEIEIFNKEDPFSNAHPEDANRWTNDGSGLELKLINALDSIWYDYFDIAMQEWDNGSPDSLSLSSEVAQAESECTPIEGVMKVCNGEYGETDWKGTTINIVSDMSANSYLTLNIANFIIILGINTVLMTNGWITTSTARMNDHFFLADNSDPDKRQYTMCHEIGHGFGLPHTDESFWNRDLGNCLDYTNNYSGNKSPDDFLYNFLTDLYGSLDGSRAPNITSTDKNSTDQGDGTGTTANQSTGGRRKMRFISNEHNLQQSHNQIFTAVKDKTRRQRLLKLWNEIDTSLIGGTLRHNDNGWRLLHRSEYGESHEIDLDYEHKIQVHYLLA